MGLQLRSVTLASGQTLYRDQGFAEDFQPLSHETFGRLGRPAAHLVSKLGGAAAAGGLLSKSAFCAAAYMEFSVAHRKGSERAFRVVAFNLAKVAGNQFTVGDLVPSV